MKKYLKGLFIILVALILVGCGNKNGVDFKNEYEALNGKQNSNGKTHRTLKISSNNPYQKVSISEIIKMIENKETFYVYFGDPMCPWCRSVIEKSIEVANKKKIKKIYYVKIWDDKGEEILRSKSQLNDSEEIELVKMGTKEYYKIIELLDNVLKEYTLTSKLNEKIPVGEKRIYAPNFIYVEEGKAVRMTEGISSKQKDSRGDLTKEVLADEEKMFNQFFK